MSHFQLRLLAILSLPGLAWSAVYQGDDFVFHQPDGTPVAVRLWGDEFSVHAETPDGWTIVKGPDRQWRFAQPAPTGGITPSAHVVGNVSPATVGLARHLRPTPGQRKDIAQAQRAKLNRDARGRPDSPTLRAARQPAPGLAAAPGAHYSPPSSSTIGTRNGVTLLIRFPDRLGDATMTRTQVDAFCNGTGYTAFGNNGSVREYFADNSFDRLDYTNTVRDYHTTSQPRSYYANPTPAPGTDPIGELIIEALDAADAAGFNFANCDGNNDGVIDGVNIFYAGVCPNDWSEGLWPHMSTINWSSNDGKVTGAYQMTDMKAALELGTFCHENGHMLCGFPDIYDYDYDSTGGAGVFCLMNTGGHGSNPMRVCGYLALAAGWRDPVDLLYATSGTRSISAESASIYRYRKPGILTEYFLIENRYAGSASGRDGNLPSSGLAIWHCDEAGGDSAHNQQTYSKPSASTNHYEVALIQADGERDFENYNNHGDLYDLWYNGNIAPGYPGTFEDGPGTDPLANDARWWSGANSQLLITNISAPGQDMQFDFGLTTLTLASVSYSVSEGNSGTTYAAISAVRTGYQYGVVSLTWSASDGTALISDLDHPGATGTLTWASGEGGTKTFLVPVNGDTKSESNETIAVSIAVPSGVLLGTANATLTVTNDDGAPPAEGSLELISYAFSGVEGTSPAPTSLQVVVQRRGGATGAVSVPWSLTPGSATAGADYNSSSGTLSWAAGDSATKTVTIPIEADSTPEADETLTITLGTATGGAIAPTPNRAIVTILNDDYGVSFGAARVRISEPYAGTVNVPVTVTRLGAVHGNFSVGYRIVADGSAIPGTDFTHIPAGTLNWTPSTTSDPTIQLPVMGDAELEGVETLSVVLENPVGCTLSTPTTATVEITDYTYSPYGAGGNEGTASKTAAMGGGCGAGAVGLLAGLGVLAGLGARRRRQR